MESKILPLELDKNANVKYWIDTNDCLFGYSLWRYENPNETTCGKLITDIPKRFLKYFDGITLNEKYRLAICNTMAKKVCR